MKKKLLLSLGTLATIASPIVAVVSCGEDEKPKTPAPTPGQGKENHKPQKNVNILSEVLKGVMADGRILDSVIQTNSLDQFINDIIRLFTTAENAHHKTHTFKDGFVFDHSNATSVAYVASKLHTEITDLLTSWSGTVATLVKANLLDDIATLDNVKEVLGQEHVTTAIMKLVNLVDLQGKMSGRLGTAVNSLLGTQEKMTNLIKSSLFKVQDYSASNPVSMGFKDISERGFVEVKHVTENDADGNPVQKEKVNRISMVPFFKDKHGESFSKNWLDHTGAFTINLGGLTRRSATVPTPVTAATQSANPAPAPLEKFDFKHLIMPYVDQDVHRQYFVDKANAKHAVYDLISMLFIELGSTPELVSQMSVNNGKLVFEDSLLKTFLDTLPNLFPQNPATGQTILKFEEDETVAKGQPYGVKVTSVLNVEAVNKNGSPTYKEAVIELQEKTTHNVVAVKEAGSLSFDFKTNNLPVISGTTLDGKAITHMTVSQLSAALDATMVPGLLQTIVMGTATSVPLFTEWRDEHYSTDALIDSPLYAGMAQRKLLGLTATTSTSVEHRNELPANADAATTAQYQSAMVQFIYQVAGFTDHLDSIKADATMMTTLKSTVIGGGVTGDAVLGTVYKQEELTRTSFERYVEGFEGSEATVKVNGQDKKIAEIFKDVLDFVKHSPIDAAWMTSFGNSLKDTTSDKLAKILRDMVYVPDVVTLTPAELTHVQEMVDGLIAIDKTSDQLLRLFNTHPNILA